MKTKPINKRWPGKWAVRATVYTSKGTRVDIETDLTEEKGEELMALLTAALEAPESTPCQPELLTEAIHPPTITVVFP